MILKHTIKPQLRDNLQDSN